MTTSQATNAPPISGPRILCLGEAIVDLIGEHHGGSIGDVGRFAPHFGGTVANVAVLAARAGARVSLAGGAGDDRWGRWLLERLESERVDTSRFALLQGRQTQLAFISVERDGTPRYELYGDPAQPIVAAVGDQLEEALAESDALFISSNTLAGPLERELTMHARERSLALSHPVIFDCDLRLHRWSSRSDAAASANACVPRAILLRASLAEAELMTGESDPTRAADALVKAGAQMVVLTIGRGRVMLRGVLRDDVEAAPRAVVSTVGAGDALTGTLLARLATSGFYPAALAAGLADGVQAASEARTRWGAID
jgi:sugar/nucleoside kinase (ribokinase family)